ncbi:hypothetical protein ACHQM5_020113 [Ranunculus cassubicifolius]
MFFSSLTHNISLCNCNLRGLPWWIGGGLFSIYPTLLTPAPAAASTTHTQLIPYNFQNQLNFSISLFQGVEERKKKAEVKDLNKPPLEKRLKEAEGVKISVPSAVVEKKDESLKTKGVMK